MWRVTCITSVCLAMTFSWAKEIPAPTTVDDPIIGGVAAAACATHGDEEGFQQRATAIIRGTAELAMAPFRRGRWEKGHDPGTYTLPIAIGRLYADAGRAEALQIVNDDRSRGETYHFAAAGWARLIPAFPDLVNAQTRQKMAGIPGNWLGGRGTDNHEAMWRTSAITLSSYQGGEAQGLNWLRNYVRNVIAAGQAEWDSPRYQPYVLKGLLNIYDFSQDQRARAWAKAGLDYIAVAYALRNTGNIYAGPTSRGNSHSPVSDNMNTIGWLWWGGPGGATDQSRLLRPAVFPATSSYRPPGVIGRIARRELLDLPFTVEQGIANYWTGLDSQPLEVEANQGHATVWVSKYATLGTAWYADDICSQMVHLRAAATTADGRNAASIIAGWPGRKDGKRTLSEGHCAVFTRKDNPQRHPLVSARHGQFAQVENVAVCLADFPQDAPDQWLYVTTHSQVRQQNGWYLFALGAATVGVYPLGKAETTREGGESMIRISGSQAGFVLAMWDDVALAKAGVRDALQRIAVDASGWPGQQRVGIRTLSGTTASMTYRPGHHFAEVLLNNEPVTHDQMYRSPYVNSAQTQLAISDGQTGYIIDVSGEVPRYLPLEGMPGTQQEPSEQAAPAARRRSSSGAANADTQVPAAEQIAAWQQELLTLCEQAIAAGAVVQFTHQRLGETEIPEVQADRLVLSARGARMAMPIRSLGHPELADLAGNLTASQGAPAAALRAAFLRLSRNTGSEYGQALRDAGDQAAAITAAWGE